MNFKSDKTYNLIVPIITITLIALILGIRYDYYYELNDDVLMKDILSGAYSGSPLSHNIQMLWPISAFISLLYRIVPVMPWYALFLLLMQFGSLMILMNRTMKICDEIDLTKIWKNIFVSAEALIYIVLMLKHLIAVQYTITVAFMAAAAIAWIATTDAFTVVPLFIITLGFLLRSEMMLLMMPFIGAAIVFKWSIEENERFTLGIIRKYIAFFIKLAIILLVCLVINKLAYSTKGWSDFVDLFNARTELYDYQVPPEYDGNEAFYDGINLSSEEAELFQNYNFGIDKKIDNKLMWQVAKYAGDLNKDTRSFSVKLSEKLKIYIYEFTHGKASVGSDYPWNIVVIALYLIALSTLITTKDYFGIWRLAALFGGRSAIWLYILMGERTPERITHSLYIVEITTLLMLILMLIKKADIRNSALSVTATVSVVFIAMFCLLINDEVNAVNCDQNLRNDINSAYIKLYEYMADNNDKLYLCDTYSTVSYSEKMFGDMADISKKNSCTLGGWSAFSPIEDDKLKEFGIDNMETGLLNDNVYFVKKKDINMDWLPEYYASKAISIDVENINTIDNTFEIYKIRGNI